MTGYESIRIALAGLGEAGNAAELAQLRKIRLATGQQLMHIRLMTYIEHQAVFIRIIHCLKGHGQLNNTKIGCQMTACPRNMIHQKPTDLLAKLLTLGIIQPYQVLVATDGLKNTHIDTTFYFFFSPRSAIGIRRRK